MTRVDPGVPLWHVTLAFIGPGVEGQVGSLASSCSFLLVSSDATVATIAREVGHGTPISAARPPSQYMA